MKSKIKVVILNEPFSYPLMPFGVYEVINGVPVRELARAHSYTEAVKIVKREGWLY